MYCLIWNAPTPPLYESTKNTTACWLCLFHLGKTTRLTLQKATWMQEAELVGKLSRKHIRQRRNGSCRAGTCTGCLWKSRSQTAACFALGSLKYVLKVWHLIVFHWAHLWHHRNLLAWKIMITKHPCSKNLGLALHQGTIPCILQAKISEIRYVGLIVF